MSDALTIDGQCADCGQPISRTESGGWCHWDTTAWPGHAARPVTGRDAEREQLAAALPHFPWCDEDGAVDDSGFPCVCHSERVRLAEHALPVVDRIANERAAAALEAAAVDVKLPGIFPSTQQWLLTRAAALRASNGEGTTT